MLLDPTLRKKQNVIGPELTMPPLMEITLSLGPMQF